MENRSKDIELEKAMEKGHWFALTNGRNRIDFTQPKIVVPYRTKDTTFAYNNVSWFAGRDVYFIVDIQENINYILGYLNSKLVKFWLSNRGKRKGDLFEIYPEPLKNIPIIINNCNNKENFIEKVNGIISLKELGKETEDLELEIDEMVYDLYELTEEEKEIVRNFEN